MPVGKEVVDSEDEELAKHVYVAVDVGDEVAIAFGRELEQQHVGRAVQTIDEKTDEKLTYRVDDVLDVNALHDLVLHERLRDDER